MFSGREKYLPMLLDVSDGRELDIYILWVPRGRGPKRSFWFYYQNLIYVWILPMYFFFILQNFFFANFINAISNRPFCIIAVFIYSCEPSRTPLALIFPFFFWVRQTAFHCCVQCLHFPSPPTHPPRKPLPCLPLTTTDLAPGHLPRYGASAQGSASFLLFSSASPSFTKRHGECGK